jgi:Dolichyl-phosphate-mannose-protein mannosyltransferase
MAGALGVVRRHWLFAVVLSLGAALRALAWAAYQPALFYSDSLNYLANTFRIPNEAWHPPGYPVFLDALLTGHHLAIVSAVQHLLVLADAVAIYLLLLRLGCARCVATLAATPLLLDAYQVQIEQYILSEALFETLLTAAVVIALWPKGDGIRRLRWWRAATVAALLGLSVLVRLDAIGLVVPLVLWVVWTARRERSWQALVPVVAAIVCFAVPVAVLVGLRGVAGNGRRINGMSPIWLYSRVAPIANCPHDDLGPALQPLCPTQPLGHRPGSIFFQDSGNAPEW